MTSKPPSNDNLLSATWIEKAIRASSPAATPGGHVHATRSPSSARRPATLLRHSRRVNLLGAILALTILSLAARLLAGSPWLQLAVVRLNQLPVAVEYRVSHWRMPTSAEEAMCLGPHQPRPNQEPIPNVAHFILLAPEGKQAEISFLRFLAMKSAIVRMEAAQIKLHTLGLNVSNPWWTQLAPYVTHVEHGRDTIRTPRNDSLTDFTLPHQADFLRLQILQREGGIYLDADVYVLQPFARLLHSPRDTVLGHEGANRYGFCNAVVLSRPQAAFLELWQATYESFDSLHWNMHSVRMPKRLAARHPGMVCPLAPTVFFWPTWAAEHLEFMHEALSEQEAAEFRTELQANGGKMYSDQMAYHAWGGGPGQVLAGLTPERLLQEDTRFNLLVREIYHAPL